VRRRHIFQYIDPRFKVVELFHRVAEAGYRVVYLTAR
jgi:hypothetical protein